MSDPQVKVDIIGDTTSLKAAYKDAEGATDKFAQSQQKTSAAVGDLNKSLASGQTSWSGWAQKTRMAEEANSDLDDALTGLLSHLDPVYKGVRQLDQGHDLLTQGLKAGLIGQTQYDRALTLLTQKFGPAAEGAGHLGGQTGLITREVRSLVNEIISGRSQQAFGTMSVLATRVGGIGIAGLGAAAGLLAVDGAFFLMAARAERTTRILNEVETHLAATGRAGTLLHSDQLQLLQQLSTMPNMTRDAAAQSLSALASLPEIGGPMIAKLSGLVADFAAATGQKAPQAAQLLGKSFASVSSGAADLNKQLNFLTAGQLLQIQSLERQGREMEAQNLLYAALQERIKGLAAQGMTPLKLATDELGNSWERFKQSFDDVASLETGARRVARLLSMITPSSGAAPAGRGATAAWDDPQTAAREAARVTQLEITKALDQGKSLEGVTTRMVELHQQADKLRGLMAKAPQDTEANVNAYRHLELQLAGLNREMANLQTPAALIRAQAEADYAVQKDFSDRSQTIIESGLKHNLLSYQEYYASREALQQFDLDKQIAKTKVELALAQEALGRTEPGTAQRAAAQGQVVGIRGQLAALGNRRGDISRTTGEQLGDAYQQLGSQMLSINATMLEAMGKTADAQVIRLSQQFGPLIQRLEAEGDTAGAEFVRKLIPIELAKTEYARLQQESDRALTAMGDQEKRLQIENQAGLITQVELQQKVIALHKAEAQALREKLPALVAAAAANPDNKQLLASLEKVRLKIAELDATGAELNRTFQFGARDAMQAYVREIDDAGRAGEHFVSGSLKSIEDDLTNTFVSGKLTVRSFGDFVINEFARIQARAIIRPFAGGISSGIDSLVGSFFGGSGGGTASMAAAAGNNGNLEGALLGQFHRGGIAGVDGTPRYVHPAYFEHAPRFHSGRIPGLAPDEIAAVIKRTEGVFTEAQMKSLAPAGGAPNVTVNVINQGGQALDVERTSAPRFDGEGYVIDVFLRRMSTDAGFRNQTRQMLAPPV